MSERSKQNTAFGEKRLHTDTIAIYPGGLCSEIDCVTMPTEDPTTYELRALSRFVKKVCALCYEKDNCLGDVLRLPVSSQPDGVVGGLTREERRKIIMNT